MRTRRRALLVVVLAGLALVLGLPAVWAQAAEIDGAVTGVRVVQDEARLGSPLRVDLDWSVPDSAAAGDTFTLQLPAELDHRVPSFDLRSPDGAVVARAVVAASGLVTFTLTAFADERAGVAGTAFFESRWDADEVAAGDRVELAFTTSTRSFTDVAAVTPGQGVDRSGPRKAGTWADLGDQGGTDPTGALRWRLESAVGPADTVRFVDTVAAGHAVDCDSLVGEATSTLAADGSASGWRQLPPARVRVLRCDAGGFDVTVTAVAAGEVVGVRYTTSVTDPSLGAYRNEASVSVDGAAGTPVVLAVRRSAAGGDGDGVVSPTPTAVPSATDTPSAPPTATPAPTVSGSAVPTPGPVVSDSAVTPAAPVPADRGAGVGGLPTTGRRTALLAGLALLGLGSGALLLVAARRRTPVSGGPR